MQADLTAVATRALEPSVAAELALLADRESAGIAAVYRFTEQSLQRAYNAGRTPTEVVAFLLERAATGVPQPLEYLVNDSFRRHGRVRVGAARAYVRADDPVMLQTVLRLNEREQLGLHQIDSHVFVAETDPAMLLARLRAAGLAPIEEHRDGSPIFVPAEGHRASPRAGLQSIWRDPTYEAQLATSTPSRESPDAADVVAALREQAETSGDP